MSDTHIAAVSYAAEVVADSTGKFCGNKLRFATDAEAKAYGRDLANRWLLVTDMRTVPTQDPVNYTWTIGVGLTEVVPA